MRLAKLPPHVALASLVVVRQLLLYEAAPMSNLPVFYFVFFGVLTIVGGVIGFVKANSRASLIAGGISGLLLLVSAYFLASGPILVGRILALVVSLALAGRFVPAFLKTKGMMPAGMMSVLSIIGIIVAVLSLI